MTVTQRSEAAKEREVLRVLAEKVAAAAADSRRMEPIRKRWRDVNALRKPDRAPVWCKPVGLWKELIPETTLVCRDTFHRGIEHSLRQILVKLELDDDTPVDPFYAVNAVLDVEPANVWGVDIAQHAAPDANGAWGYKPPLIEVTDFDRLRQPVYRYNAAATEHLMERVDGLIGDLLPPRRVCLPPLNATYGQAAALRGLEQIMMDVIDAPELLHRLMAHLRDANLATLDALEKTRVLTANHDLPDGTMGPSIYSESIGVFPKESVASANLWCAANSQEFDQVSPAMWGEFCLEYQKPVFARSGLVCYGCCENLTQKLDGVLSIPNIRIVVCSAWTDKDVLLAKVPADRCVIMWRQKASEVCVPNDDAQIRNDLLAGAKRFQGRYYQIVLRELQTLMGHTGRLHAWVRFAKEAAEKYA